MLQSHREAAQKRMNAEYHRILEELLTNAERDLRLTHSAGAVTAEAQAHLDTLRAALGIYASSHLIACGERPWPREARA